MRIGIVLRIALLAIVTTSAQAAPRQARCTATTGDPRVTVEDVIDIELEGRVLHSLRWTAERTTRDARAETHALECDVAIDPARWSITPTRRGSVAVAHDDRRCRFEFLGSGDQVAVIPHCASRCQPPGRYRSLALNLERGICQPLRR